jgi:tetratricopeptide (TPR) repeat protein
MTLVKFIPFKVFLFICLPFVFASPPQSGQQNLTEDDRKNLFPGTGFFIKNRDPYSNEEAKSWFVEASNIQKNGDLAGALKLYEKFTKRRSDMLLIYEGKSFLIGPESLYRAAILRENKGDWSDAFEHLELIAVAYPRYDFERVTESLMRIAEKIVTEDLPRKWGFVPRFRSGSEDRSRLDRIAELARGPRFAPRALMALADAALQEGKEEDAIIALEKVVNLYPDHHACERAYFLLAVIHEGRVSGPAYDQGSTLKALNFYEDYLILFERAPAQGKYETSIDYGLRIDGYEDRKKKALQSKREMRQVLAASKLVIGEYIEDYGKYFIIKWEELGNQPALQFYNEAITAAPESEAARLAEKRVADLRSTDD